MQAGWWVKKSLWKISVGWTCWNWRVHGVHWVIRIWVPPIRPNRYWKMHIRLYSVNRPSSIRDTNWHIYLTPISAGKRWKRGKWGSKRICSATGYTWKEYSIKRIRKICLQKFRVSPVRSLASVIWEKSETVVWNWQQPGVIRSEIGDIQ